MPRPTRLQLAQDNATKNSTIADLLKEIDALRTKTVPREQFESLQSVANGYKDELAQQDQANDDYEKTNKELEAYAGDLRAQLAAKNATLTESIYRPEAARIVQEACAHHLNTDMPALLALRPGQEPDLWRLHGRLTLARELAAIAPQLFPSPAKP